MSINNLLKPSLETPAKWTNLNVNSIKTRTPVFEVETGSVSVTHDVNPKTTSITFSSPLASAPNVVSSIVDYTYLTKPISIYNSNVTTTGFDAIVNIDNFKAKSLQTVFSTGNVGAYCSLAVILGRPAIAYKNLPTDVIAYSINAEPDGSGAWSHTTAAPFPHLYVSMKEINGVPMISYTDGTNVRLAVSTDADGLGVWTDNLAYVEAANWTSLCEVDGVPCIAYTSVTGAYLLRSAAADGSGPWTRYTIELSTEFNYISLNIIDGRPAVSYYVFNVDDLKFAICDNITGTGSWTIQTANTDGGSMTSLALVDGRPAISFASRIDDILRYTINSAADGSGIWSTYVIDFTFTTPVNGTSLAVIDGNPAISFTATDNALKYARSLRPDGEGSWNVYVIDDTAADTGRFSSLAELGDSNPGIAYHSNTGEDLRFATGTLSEITYDIDFIASES